MKIFQIWPQMFAQICVYILNTSLYTLSGWNYTVCELYTNKAIKILKL